MNYPKIANGFCLSIIALLGSGCLETKSDDSFDANNPLTVIVQPEKGPFQRTGTVEAWGLKNGHAPQRLILQKDRDVSFTDGKASLVFAIRSQVIIQEQIIFLFRDSEFTLNGDFTGDQEAKGIKRMTEPFFASLDPKDIGTTAGQYEAPKADLLDHLAISSALGKAGILNQNTSFDEKQITTSVITITDSIREVARELVQSYAGLSAGNVTITDRIKARTHLVAQLIQAAVNSEASALNESNSIALGEKLGSLTKQMITTSNRNAILTTPAGFLKPLPPSVRESFQASLEKKLQKEFGDQITSEIALIDFDNLFSPSLDDALQASPSGNETQNIIWPQPESPATGELTNGDTPRPSKDLITQSNLEGKIFMGSFYDNIPRAGSSRGTMYRVVLHFMPNHRFVHSYNYPGNSMVSHGFWEVYQDTLRFYGLTRSASYPDFYGFARSALYSDFPGFIGAMAFSLDGQDLTLRIKSQYYSGGVYNQAYTLDTTCNTNEIQTWPYIEETRGLASTPVCHTQKDFELPELPHGGFTEQIIGNQVFETPDFNNTGINRVETMAFTPNRRYVTTWGLSGVTYGIWRVFQGFLIQVSQGIRPISDSQIQKKQPVFRDIMNLEHLIPGEPTHPYYSLEENTTTSMIFRDRIKSIQRVKGSTCPEGTLRIFRPGSEHCVSVFMILETEGEFSY